MAYTVKKLTQLSGVSVRTLHFYDEIGLLKPAYYGSAGYRYYEEPQLLRLQQILFFRELGFELKQIQKILERSDFDQLVALSSHKQVLQKNLERTRKLIKTIEKTIDHLKRSKKMKDKDFYSGFSKEKQMEYEKYLIDRFGDKIKKTIAESHKKTDSWTKEDWKRNREEFDGICKELVVMMKHGRTANSSEVQRAIRKHFEWLKNFWTPTKETYFQHADLIHESDLRKAYDEYHPGLAEFVAQAIKVFSKKELD